MAFRFAEIVPTTHFSMSSASFDQEVSLREPMLLFRPCLLETSLTSPSTSRRSQKASSSTTAALTTKTTSSRSKLSESRSSSSSQPATKSRQFRSAANRDFLTDYFTEPRSTTTTSPQSCPWVPTATRSWHSNSGPLSGTNSDAQTELPIPSPRPKNVVSIPESVQGSLTLMDRFFLAEFRMTQLDPTS
jgi:hypothetical protein